MNRAALIVVLALAPAAASAQAPPPAPVSTPVGSFQTTISGQPIVLPPGPIAVTVSRTDLPAGGVIPAHKHPFQRINYVLEGGVRVTNLDTGDVKEFRAGQVIVETRDQWHKGEALDGKPARLLAIDETPPGAANMVRQ